jgi:hypothetical protein
MNGHRIRVEFPYPQIRPSAIRYDTSGNLPVLHRATHSSPNSSFLTFAIVFELTPAILTCLDMG